MSGLAGILTAGTTGLEAAISHSPCSGAGKEKYVFFLCTHVAVDEKGVEGKVLRKGRPNPSHACGAIVAIKHEFDSHNISHDDEFDFDNVEYSILKKKLYSKICGHGWHLSDAMASFNWHSALNACHMRAKQSSNCYIKDLGANPTIFELTKATSEIITSDIENLICKTVDPRKSDYAVITGVHIHAGRHGGSWTSDAVIDYIAPLTAYAVIGGRYSEFKIDGRPFFTEKMASWRIPF